jgi:hypothetical protein
MRSFVVVATSVLALCQGTFALPEPVGEVTPNDRHLALMKRATNCGMNVHEPSKCPDGAECNCAIQNPVRLIHPSLANNPALLAGVTSSENNSNSVVLTGFAVNSVLDGCANPISSIGVL